MGFRPRMTVRHIALFCAALLAAVAVSGCSLPRGAAMSSEVLRGQDEPATGFEVVAVSRSNMDRLATWPTSAGQRGYHWPERRRGPDSSVIRPGDGVELSIWDNQENSLLTSGAEKLVTMPNMVVSSSGSLFVPYLGEVSVGGQTPFEARASIQRAMEAIVPSAQVQLSVKQGKLNTVNLVSGFNSPGNYPMPDRNYPVLSAVAAAGGISPELRNPVLRLLRDGQTYQINTKTLFADASRNITLRGGDSLLVEEDDRYFTALGATGEEKLVYFDRERVNALEAVSLVGGLTDSRADPKGLLILRDYPAKAMRIDGTGPSLPQVVFTFDLTATDGLFAARNFAVQPGDTFLATESPLVAARTVMGLIGSVFGLRSSATGN